MADPTKQGAPVMQAPFKLQSLDKSNKWLKALIYGGHGAGKTSLSGSAADVDEMSDVLFINIEAGDLSLMDSPMINRPDRIVSVPVIDYKVVAEIHKFLKAHCRLRDADDTEGLKKLQAMFTGQNAEEIETPWKFRTVIVDSISELDALCMYHLLGVKLDDKIEVDMEVAQFAEFRKNNQMMQSVVRAFRNLPMHVILVAAAKYEQDEIKRMHWQPRITGQLASSMQGAVDLVGYLMTGNPDDKGNIPRRLQVQPGPKFDAKNRVASFKQPYIDNPTMAKVMDALKLV